MKTEVVALGILLLLVTLWTKQLLKSHYGLQWQWSEGYIQSCTPLATLGPLAKQGQGGRRRHFVYVFTCCMCVWLCSACGVHRSVPSVEYLP